MRDLIELEDRSELDWLRSELGPTLIGMGHDADSLAMFRCRGADRYTIGVKISESKIWLITEFDPQNFNWDTIEAVWYNLDNARRCNGIMAWARQQAENHRAQLRAQCDEQYASMEYIRYLQKHRKFWNVHESDLKAALL